MTTPSQHSTSARPDPRLDARHDARDDIIDALLALAADMPFADITLTAIAERAGLSLAHLRSAFPSKGAIIGAYTRRIDLAVLNSCTLPCATISPHQRLYDVLIKRLELMQPQRAALHSIFTWVKNDPISAAPLNTSIINSMRFMLEAAGLSSEGMMGALVLQAMALKWAEVVAIWLGDDEPLQDKTCAALHRMLDEGALWVNRLNAFESNASRLFKNLCADRRTTGNDRNDPSRPEYEHWRADHRAD